MKYILLIIIFLFWAFIWLKGTADFNFDRIIIGVLGMIVSFSVMVAVFMMEIL